ncbi:peptidoglycan recognition protein family protein [Kitasatospora griseola]|uniref:peptidoglycan recognition protein family protein n=1 Tax=Kitasatospora griseola TaxID=2064 RepID=UPI00342EAC18
MSRMPGATWRPVRNRRPGGTLEHRGLVLHVQEGDNSPFGWFDNPASQASSDFWVAKDGRIEQYVETGTDRAWAQAAGNAFYASVETEGHPAQPLTGDQVDGVARIYAWGHREFGWPLAVVDSTTEHGLTYHGVGGAAWGGHPGCPGELRKAQRGAIIARARVLLGDAEDRPEPPPPQQPAAHPAWPGRYLRAQTPMLHGDDVRQWQQRMRDRGWRIDADGWYGPASAEVARAFQSEKGLGADGVVGPRTWDAAWTAPVS